jgi:hypothetical protein
MTDQGTGQSEDGHDMEETGVATAYAAGMSGVNPPR